MTRGRRGFTLLEVLVTLAIMSMVMLALYVTLDGTLRARDQLEIESRVARLGPEILDLVEADLRRAWILNIDEDAVFRGEARTIDGEAADSLHFLSNVDSTLTRRIGERELSSDVCETGYALRRNPVLPDVLELWRRQSFHVDEDPLRNGDHGVYELLHDRVVRFQVRYRERVDPLEEPLHDWDAAARHRLPALVEIELALEAVPRTIAERSRREGAGRTLVYRRSIPMPDRSDMAMRVHPLPPAFVAAGGTSGGANLGGDTDQDGDGQPDGGGADEGIDAPDNPFGGGGGGGDFGDFLDDLLNGGGGGGG